MVSLLGLASYSPEQIERARNLSSAFARYEQILAKLPRESLHSQRIEGWLKCVLATYHNTASTEAICASWSDLADQLLQQAWLMADLSDTSGVLLALGKHGARELNLSSDIDLIIVSEPQDAHRVERGIRKFQRLLQTSGDAGLCYRLDFDLRPGGKMGALVTTPSQFQDHYWSQGETWERLALVRARAIVGSEALGRQILLDAHKFSYRKFLDFTLLEDLKALRKKVHQLGFTRRTGEIHLKLEVGGIRDIELFTHSLLILNGGKLPELQTQSTSAALLKIGERGIIPRVEADELLATYWYYRHLENLVQSIEDRQTHSISVDLSQVTGHTDFREIETKLARVDTIVSSLLGQVDAEGVSLPQGESQQHLWLSELGFSPQAIESTWTSLMRATALSHKNDRDERTRQQFLYIFLQAIGKQVHLDRDLGLAALLEFVKATRAKATFFAMLLNSPRLIQDLARLFCLSPYLGSIVSSRPELLDHFILQMDDIWNTDFEVMLQQMTERKLLTELWSANQFLADFDTKALGARVTSTAESICTELLRRLSQDFDSSGVQIIAMGKWAGYELGLRSDLDFIFISKQSPRDVDFKVARRFISRLTDPAKGGSLYDVDLRLRPSGQSGPLLVTLEQLHDYWQTAAQPWERQAYLRARVVNSDLVLEKFRLTERGLSGDELESLRAIRLKLLKPTTADTIQVKYAPGGLLDIEFVTQTAILHERLALTAATVNSTCDGIACLMQNSPQWKSHGAQLIQLYQELRVVEQILRLSATRKIVEVKRSDPAFANAARLQTMTVDQYWIKILGQLKAARILLDELDPTGLKLAGPVT